MRASSTHRRSENSSSSEQDARGPHQRVRSVILCGSSVRSLTESAIQAGFRPLCVDFFEDADLKKLLQNGRGRFIGRINSFRELPNCVRSVRRNVPMVWAGGLENHYDVLREIAGERVLIGPDLPVVEHVRNPEFAANCLAETGIRVPLISRSHLDPYRTWLCKSSASSGGLGIRPVNVVSSVASESISGEDDMFFQEYIDGVSMSATFVSSNKACRLIGTSLQLNGWTCLGASGFQFCGNAGPVQLPPHLQAQLLSAGNIFRSLGLRGVFGSDFVLRNGELWFLEVNPRLTASHMLYDETQADSTHFLQHLNALGYCSARATPRRKSLSSAEQPTAVIRLVVWSQRELSVGRRLAESTWRISETCRLCDIPEVDSIIPAASPVCSVEFLGTTFHNVIQDVAGLQEKRTLQFLCNWPAVADSLTSLSRRFEANVVHERRQNPARRRS